MQGHQKASLHMTITVQTSGAQRLFYHPANKYWPEDGFDETEICSQNYVLFDFILM
jgi:hypothetical protein